MVLFPRRVGAGLFAAVFLAVVVAGPAAADDEELPCILPGGACTTNPDAATCEEGTSCVRGRCRAEIDVGGNCAVTSKTFCAGGLACHAGVCMEVAAAGGDCDVAESVICPAGYTCEEGTCLKKVKVGDACSAGAHAYCRSGAGCVNGTCKKLIPLGEAITIKSKQACEKPGFSRNGKCLERAGAGGACGATVPSFCVDDLRCSNGLCKAEVRLGEKITNTAQQVCPEPGVVTRVNNEDLCLKVDGSGEACGAGLSVYCLQGTKCEAGRCKKLVQLGGPATDPNHEACAEGEMQSGRCLTRSVEGGKCGEGVPAFCDGTLICVSGKCSTVVHHGGACTSGTVCAAGSQCIGRSCKEEVALGGLLVNPNNQYCAAGSTNVGGKCLKEKLIWEPCNEAAHEVCPSGLVCKDFCRPDGLLSACGVASPCKGRLICHSGTCKEEVALGNPIHNPTTHACVPGSANVGNKCVIERLLWQPCNATVHKVCQAGLVCKEFCRPGLPVGDACVAGGPHCQQGLVCHSGKCLAEVALGLYVTNPDYQYCAVGSTSVGRKCLKEKLVGEPCNVAAHEVCPSGAVCTNLCLPGTACRDTCTKDDRVVAKAVVALGGLLVNPSVQSCAAGLTNVGGKCLKEKLAWEYCNEAAHEVCPAWTACKAYCRPLKRGEPCVLGGPICDRGTCYGGRCDGPVLSSYFGFCGPDGPLCEDGHMCIAKQCRMWMKVGESCAELTRCGDGAVCVNQMCVRP